MPKGGRGGKRVPSTKPKWSNTPNSYKIPKTLKEAIGEKGKAKSMAEAYYDANPHFSYDYNEFKKNCQRCVMAYELRRRGYDVEALPTYENDEMPKSKNWLKALSGTEEVNVGRRTQEGVFNAIKDQMKKWGDGSRAILKLEWAGKKSGHVENVEYNKGVLYAFDSQNNKQSINSRLIKEDLSQAVLKKTELIRVDKAKITENMKYMVKKK